MKTTKLGLREWKKSKCCVEKWWGSVSTSCVVLRYVLGRVYVLGDDEIYWTKFLLFSFVYDVERSGSWSQGFPNRHWSSLFTHSLAVTIHDSWRNYRCRWITNICRLKLESGLSKACAEANISDRPKSYISVCKVSSRVRSNITRPTSMKI